MAENLVRPIKITQNTAKPVRPWPIPVRLVSLASLKMLKALKSVPEVPLLSSEFDRNQEIKIQINFESWLSVINYTKITGGLT